MKKVFAAYIIDIVASNNSYLLQDYFNATF